LLLLGEFCVTIMMCCVATQSLVSNQPVAMETEQRSTGIRSMISMETQHMETSTLPATSPNKSTQPVVTMSLESTSHSVTMGTESPLIGWSTSRGGGTPGNQSLTSDDITDDIKYNSTISQPVTPATLALPVSVVISCVMS